MESIERLEELSEYEILELYNGMLEGSDSGFLSEWTCTHYISCNNGRTGTTSCANYLTYNPNGTYYPDGYWYCSTLVCGSGNYGSMYLSSCYRR